MTLLSTLLLLYQPIQAEQLSASFTDFSGGLNDWAENLQLNESPNVQNFHIDEGKLAKRKGYSKITNLPARGLGIYPYSPAAGDNRLMIWCDNGIMYQQVIPSSAAPSGLVTVKTGISTGTVIDCATVRGDFWCVQESTTPFIWDGAIVDSATGAPRGAYIEYYDNRVFIAKTLASPSSVFFSNLIDSAGNAIAPKSGTAWPAINELFVARQDADVIMGMKVYDTIQIFKERSIHYLEGTDEFSYQFFPSRNDVGTTSNQSIVEVGGILHVLDRHKLYQFNGKEVLSIVDNKSYLFNDINHDLVPRTNVIDEQFTDNQITSNPIWTVVVGSWNANGGSLVSSPTVSGSCTTGATTDCPLVKTTSTQTNGIWSFDLGLPILTSGITLDVCFMTTTDCNTGNLGAGSAYYLEFTATATTLKKDAGTTLASAGPVGNTTEGSTSTIKIFKQGDSISVYDDNIMILSANDSGVTSSSWFSILDGIFARGIHIDNISIYSVAQSSTTSDEKVRAWGAKWKDRYWLTYNRIGKQTKDKVLVKSREPLKSYVPFTGMNFNAMTQLADNFYAVDSGTNAVLQVDITNDDGSTAIDSIWESRNESFGRLFSKKSIKHIYSYSNLFDNSTTNSFTLGYSRDQGKSYTSNTISNSGVSIPAYVGSKLTRRTSFNPREANNFRFRVRNNVVNTTLEIFGIAPVVNIIADEFTDIVP